MEKGEANVSYSVSGTHYKRDIFVSRADNLVAYRITKQGGGTINVKLVLSLIHRVNARTYEGICNMPEGVKPFTTSNLCVLRRETRITARITA